MSRTLSKGQTVFRLQPKEAALLALFMCNAGRALSRREILKEVWDLDYVDDTRTLFGDHGRHGRKGG